MEPLLQYESKQEPLLPKELFISRLLRNILAGSLILGLFLGVGMLGYHFICGFNAVDSFLNASMILSGMGPVTPENCAICLSDSCKIFAGVYALVSGVGFITTIGLILAPIAHRVFHRFHLESDDDEK